MNQYRCETCDKDCVYANQTPTDELFYCQKFEYDWVRKFTSVKGCTSHSNFQSERDKVLDGDWVRDKFFEWVNSRERPPSLYACEQQWKKLVELRQKAGD
jgi:hypothetical protein